MQPIWVVMRGESLISAHTFRADAEAVADRLRSEDVSAADTSHPVRVETCDLRLHAPPGSRRPHSITQEAINALHRDWGLWTLAEMGTAHFLHVETYLAVPHEGILKFPSFQFTHERVLHQGFREAMNALRDNGWDDASIALWFVNPQASVGNWAPALVIRDDPKSVLRAARTAGHAM
jgi:hypothetical protein